MILTIFPSSWCVLGLTEPLLVLGKWIAFPERRGEGWKNESYCNAWRSAGVAVRDEVKTSQAWKPQIVLKKCLLERPSRRSQFFWLVCVGTLLEIGSRIQTGTSVLRGRFEGSWLLWPLGDVGCSLSASAIIAIFCQYRHCHPQIVFSPAKTVNLAASE